MCPNRKNATLILLVSSIFLIFSLSFAALAYVGGKTENTQLLKKKKKASRKAVRSQQKEIKKKLRNIESKLKIRGNKNVTVSQ